MRSCDDIRGRLWAWLDGELGAAERAEVADHLGRCPGCARDVERAAELLAIVREAGRETAPPGLVTRVEAILDRERGGPAVEAGAPAASRAAAPESSADRGPAREPAAAPRRRRWAALVPLAAILAALLIARPWAGEPAGALAATAFVADHAAHAAAAPSAEPFRPGEAAPTGPPSLPGGRLAGLSRCVVDGRVYAHWTFEVEGGRVSAYVPVEGRLGEPADPPVVDGAAVVTVEEGGRRTLLVSTDLGPEALRALSPGA